MFLDLAFLVFGATALAAVLGVPATASAVFVAVLLFFIHNRTPFCLISSNRKTAFIGFRAKIGSLKDRLKAQTLLF